MQFTVGVTSTGVLFVMAYLRLSLMFVHCNGRVCLSINVFVYCSHHLSPVVFGGSTVQTVQIVQRRDLKTGIYQCFV